MSDESSAAAAGAAACSGEDIWLDWASASPSLSPISPIRSLSVFLCLLKCVQMFCYLLGNVILFFLFFLLSKDVITFLNLQ